MPHLDNYNPDHVPMIGYPRYQDGEFFETAAARLAWLEKKRVEAVEKEKKTRPDGK
jgi:hypothetical protein